MFYERLQELCRGQGKKLTSMLSDLGMSSSATGRWQGGSLPNGETLIRLANYFDVSLDYLLTGEEHRNPSVHVSGVVSGSAVVQGISINRGSVIVRNGNEHTLSDEAAELLRVYETLTVKQRHKILALTFELEENSGKDDSEL